MAEQRIGVIPRVVSSGVKGVHEYGVLRPPLARELRVREQGMCPKDAFRKYALKACALLQRALPPAVASRAEWRV